MKWENKKKLYVFQWDVNSPVQTFAHLANQPYSVFLDSARPSHPLSRYSYIGWHPFETIESKAGRVTITNAENQFTYRADPFQVVRERLALWGEDTKPRSDLPPFQGGAIGFFGYDLARAIERLPAHTQHTGQSDMCIGLYDKIIAFDHDTGKAFLMIHAESDQKAQVCKAYIERMAALPAPAPYMGATLEWTTERDDDSYKNDIRRIVDYIYAGDIFQANLSRRFSAGLPQGFDAFAHYAHLREINGAPYGAFLNFGDMKLASASPERFLEVRGRDIETRPIKGTMPSSKPAEMLANSEKDRAENIMIVDLLRNDLSKVCEDHSIEIDGLCSIETFEGLHHMVSTVYGKLRGDKGAVDALRACFPGGSITGAPKIRAMEIIEELEIHRRGAYCGAMAWMGYDGAMDSAITIRTLVYEADRVHLQTGGGVTAESNAEREVEETLTKAAKMFESFAPAAAKRQVA